MKLLTYLLVPLAYLLGVLNQQAGLDMLYRVTSPNRRSGKP